MGQEPNIELDRSDLPRIEPERAPERRWSPNRPGEITAPSEMPQGPAFGRPSPDTGWALRLLRFANYDRTAAGPYSDDVLVALMSARASRLGRAPTREDVEVALILLGLEPSGLEAQTFQVLAQHRKAWLHAAAHEWSKGTAALEAIPTDLLLETPIHLRTRLNQNPGLIGSGPVETRPV